MAKLDERIATLQERLQQLKVQQQRTAARQTSIQSRRQRKADAQRKDLVGVMILARVEQGRMPEAELHTWLDEVLIRPDVGALLPLESRIV